MRIGIDYRPALINREGIGRVTRELVRALGAPAFESDVDALALFGWTLAPMRVARDELGLDERRARLTRFRFPSRWIPAFCARTGRGADDLAGGCDVFHHTQPHVLPVRAAVEVSTIYDCLYALGRGFVSDDAAASMTAAARTQIERSRIVLVPSAYVAADAVRVLGADPARVHVAPLGCDHVLRHASRVEVERERGLVLTVSRVDARKNHVRALRTFERLVRERLATRWIVAGPDGHGCEELDAALASSDARDRVTRLRFVDERELADLCARCALFLFPSLGEGFGLPPLEAMALGAAVVAGDNSSQPEVLGDAAVLVDAQDEEALFEATRSVLGDEERARDLARKGRERAARFTWEAAARATLDGYRRAVGG